MTLHDIKYQSKTIKKKPSKILHPIPKTLPNRWSIYYHHPHKPHVEGPVKIMEENRIIVQLPVTNRFIVGATVTGAPTPLAKVASTHRNKLDTRKGGT